MKLYIRASQYDPKDNWTQEDIDLHQSIDWRSRNYEEYEVTDDTFFGDVTFYTNNGPATFPGVEFVKVIRANPIYPPYYRPKDQELYKNPLNTGVDFVGPMYDGNTHNGYDVHDRYETQQIYDALSN